MPNYTIGRDLLKNKVGAKTPKELERLETPLVAARAIELATDTTPTMFDGDALKTIHRYLFQDVFEWAGRTRDERVRLSDGTVATEETLRKPDHKPFMAASRIARALSFLGPRAKRLANSRGLTRERFATQAGDLLLTLNNIHPFREGNGRTQRIFLAEIAIAAGHPLDFSVITKERMTRASIAGNEQNDRASMRRLMLDALDPQRVAMLAKAIMFLDRSGFEDRNERYIATLHDTKPIDLVFAGAAGDDFMARTGEDILIGRVKDLPTPRPKMGETFQASRAKPSIADDMEPPDDGGSKTIPNADGKRPMRQERQGRKQTEKE